MMHRRSGFTIVEMMVVVAILAVLLGIVGTAARAAVRSAREKRAEALAEAWRNAITSYYAQKGEWPGKIESHVKSDKNIVTLSKDEANAVFQEIVDEVVTRNNALIDVSSLYVCLSPNAEGCDDKHKDCRCPSMTEFSKAYADGKGIKSMAFGYPGVSLGKFRRFIIKYNTQADTVSVGR